MSLPRPLQPVCLLRHGLPRQAIAETLWKHLALFSAAGVLLLWGVCGRDAAAAEKGSKAAAGPAAEKIGYNRSIRPILAENCFQCHGPDSAARKANLRLDRREEAIKAGAIAPGDVESSELVARITADEADQRMPPPATHKTLTAEQKELLKRWIASGAPYEPHWSLIAPRRPPLPAVKNMAWVRNAIDRFVLAKLEEQGLAPAPEADRRTLARRLSLDLIGLPPAPVEVEAFVGDASPDAYEKFVDRLCRAPQWGEHRARYWLDLARYGDTHGIHIDNYREIWAYRDWVIDAFNRNLPFDRFTMEQLAGDLLPHPTLDQQIASGFHRCNITTNEGGAIPEEYAVLYARDRTETTSQVWLGLTAGCAVCHDHKFDPITQKDFYAMSAFFNNTTQEPMDGNIKDTPPVVVVPKPEDRSRWEALDRQAQELQQQIANRKQKARAEFDHAATSLQPEAVAKTISTKGLRLHAALDEGKGRAIRASIDGQPRTLTAKNDLAWESGYVSAHAFQTKAKQPIELGEAADFDKDQAFSLGLWVRLPKHSQTGALVARMDDGPAFNGWDLWLDTDRPAVQLIHHWPDDALMVLATKPLPPDRWTHLLVTYDGSRKPGGLKIYVNAQLQKVAVSANGLRNSIHARSPLMLGQRYHGYGVEDIALADLRIYDRALPLDEADRLLRTSRAILLAGKAFSRRTPAESEELFAWWLPTFDTPFQKLTAAQTAVDAEQNAIKARGTVAHVMHERSTPPAAYVLYRGDYDKRRDQVTPATFAALPPMPPELPRNRLGLAEWLVRPENPLVARVTVNHFWQEAFGWGLVRSSGDFGINGEMPSHPELLDWLAVDFRESGWDVKRLFKMIVTSATYRQAARATPEKIEKDPLNRLLARGPRFRMDAEMVRDYALAASGLLAPKIGGPSVKPYQPEGVWEAVAMTESNTRFYKQEHGENLYRRSLYTFWKRSAPPASMEIFNAPARETCTVRRDRTDTPLQALVTLNDPQFVEAARHLAQTALATAAPTPESRSDFLARRLLARPLREEESRIVEAAAANLLDYYRAHPGDAKALLSVGESPADPRLDAPSLAAWTMVANSLLNLDEVLNK